MGEGGLGGRRPPMAAGAERNEGPCRRPPADLQGITPDAPPSRHTLQCFYSDDLLYQPARAGPCRDFVDSPFRKHGLADRIEAAAPPRRVRPAAERESRLAGEAPEDGGPRAGYGTQGGGHPNRARRGFRRR